MGFYIYGADRFNEDFEFMIGHRPNFFWQVTWRFVSPLIVFVIMIFYFVTQFTEQLDYSAWDPSSVNFPALEKVFYPSWINFIIFLLAGVSSLSVPGFAIFKLLQRCCCRKNTYEAE